MKTSITFLLSLLLAILFSCSSDVKLKDSAILNSGFVEVTSSPVTHNTIINVLPNGNDDTDNLYAAFNQAIAAGPGSIVQLTSGNFLISRPVVIADFSGTFRGAGKDLTKVANLHDVPFPLATNWPGEPLYTDLFKFYQTTKNPRSLKISNISFEAKGESVEWPGFPGYNFFHHIIGVFGQVNGIKDLQLEPSRLDCSFESVGLDAETINDQPSALNGIQLYAEDFLEDDGSWTAERISGTYTFRKCSFKNIIWSASIGMGAMVDSKIIIGGDKKNGNEFENVGYAVWIGDISNTVAEVSYNKCNNIYYYGNLIQQGFWKPLFPEQIITSSEILIKHNDFHIFDPGDAIGLEDAQYFINHRKTLKATVSDNNINLDNTSYRGIYGFYMHDVLVINNTIVGNCLAAISVGACPYGDCAYGGEPLLHTDSNLESGWQIIGNNVKDVNASIAPIYLGPGSSNCLVVGNGSLTNVLDEGTKNKLVNTGRAVPKHSSIHQGMRKEMPGMKGRRF